MIDPALRKKLVREDRWSRIFEVAPNSYAYESKLKDGETVVSAEELRADWLAWSAAQRLEFAQAFQQRQRLTPEDERILEFLMSNGDDRIWSTIALVLVHHSNRRLVVEFLVEKLLSTAEPRANLIQALYVIGDRSTLPVLRQMHDRLSREVSSDERTDDAMKIVDFLTACKALAYLEKSARYESQIRSFLAHPDEIIRIQAQLALEGPQPEEFGVEPSL